MSLSVFEMPVTQRSHKEAEDDLRVKLPEETEDREHTQELEFVQPSVKTTVTMPAASQVSASYANKMPLLPSARSGNLPVLTPQSSVETLSPTYASYQAGSPNVMRLASTASSHQNVTMQSPTARNQQVIMPSPCMRDSVSPSVRRSSKKASTSHRGSPQAVSSHRGSPKVTTITRRSSPQVMSPQAMTPQAVASPSTMTRHRGTPEPVTLRPVNSGHIMPTTPSHPAQYEYVMTPQGTRDPYANAFVAAQIEHTPMMPAGPGQVPMTPTGHAPPPMTPQGPPMTPQGAGYPPQAALSQCLMSVKPADQMNHIEAARWIGTIGRLKKWAEADTYARNCQAHEISGFMLSQLTMQDLETVLGMKKHGHRLELWCSIRQIFPYLLPFERKKRDPDVNEVQKWGRGSDNGLGSVTTMLTFRNNNSSRASTHGGSAFRHGKQSMMSRSQSRRSALSCMSETSVHSGRSGSIRSGHHNDNASSVRTSSTAAAAKTVSTRLMLTLKPEQQVEDKIGTMTKIRNYFLEKGFKVEIGTVDMDDRRFILFFRDEQETNRALSMNDDFDYDVSPYSEPVKKRSKRPTPGEPIRYMVLNRSRLRAGKSLKAEWRGELYKGDIVWVNQIKGRRARIIRAKDDPTVRGWVSLRSNNGFQLLTQFQDNE